MGDEKLRDSMPQMLGKSGTATFWLEHLLAASSPWTRCRYGRSLGPELICLFSCPVSCALECEPDLQHAKWGASSDSDENMSEELRKRTSMGDIALECTCFPVLFLPLLLAIFLPPTVLPSPLEPLFLASHSGTSWASCGPLLVAQASPRPPSRSRVPGAAAGEFWRGR